MSTEFLFVTLPGDWFLPIPLICLFDPRVLLAILLSIRLASPWPPGSPPHHPTQCKSQDQKCLFIPGSRIPFGETERLSPTPSLFPLFFFFFWVLGESSVNNSWANSSGSRQIFVWCPCSSCYSLVAHNRLILFKKFL